MEKLHQLYDGQAKRVYATDNPNAVILSFKDEATAYGGLKRSHIDGKGAVNNRVSYHLMEILEQHGIPTHLISLFSDHETLVKKVRLLPIAVIVRNVAAGTLSNRLGVPDGTVLRHPIIELNYRGIDLSDRLVNKYHVTAMGWATEPVLEEITAMAHRINEILLETFHACEVELIDFGLEFGTTVDGMLVLADEISPDTCRLWDSRTHEKLDKDRFRMDMDGVEEAYQEIARRLLGE